MSHDLTEKELNEWEATLKGYPEDHRDRIIGMEIVAHCRNCLVFGIPVVVDDNPKHVPTKRK